MILTGKEIVRAVEAGEVRLEPFSADQVNPNSYNYRLGDRIKTFVGFDGGRSSFAESSIPPEGVVLEPGRMYLATTRERIGSARYAMSLIGRSSLGRLGLFL